MTLWSCPVLVVDKLSRLPPKPPRSMPVLNDSARYSVWQFAINALSALSNRTLSDVILREHTRITIKSFFTCRFFWANLSCLMSANSASLYRRNDVVPGTCFRSPANVFHVPVWLYGYIQTERSHKNNQVLGVQTERTFLTPVISNLSTLFSKKLSLFILSRFF